MLAEYLPTLLFLIVAGGIGVALLVMGKVLGPQRPTLEKLPRTSAVSKRSKVHA